LPPRTNAPVSRLDRVALAIAASVAIGCAFIFADAATRDAWDGISVARYGLGALALYAIVGTAAGVAWAILFALEGAVARAASRRGVSPGIASAALFGVVAASASASTAFWAFRGNGVARSTVARVGPFVATLAVGAAAAGVAFLAKRADAARRDGRPRLAIVVASIAIVVGAVLAWADLELYVALYARLHSALELAAATLWGTALSLAAPPLVERSRGARHLARAVAAACVAFCVLAAASKTVRAFPARELAHARREPDYLGRMLLRLELVEDFVANPRAWRGETQDEMARLLREYDLQTTSRGHAWDDHPPEPPRVRDATDAIRRGCARCNVLVFYVDTLRWDAANDPAIMPAMRDFAAHAVAYDSAFTVGSDTTHALAGILRGGYDLDRPQPDDLLAMARRGTDAQALVIPQSAAEFLAKQRPDFRFDDTLRIADYDPARTSVWGYGADRPSAEPMVDAALSWLGAHAKARFFLWMFNFDVHNWREIDGDHLERVAAETGLPEEADLNWRYRAAARSVDRAFARLLEGLDRLGLSNDTIVVALADHGEGLGQFGFWVHSTFVWHSLVHVPLAIRIPGVAPRVVQDRVSLVDVAPTLARFFVPDADLTRYQGEDLLARLVPNPPKRRLPILLVGSDRDGLAHLGLVEPEGRYKLVLPLRPPIPELYDLEADDPDALDVADRNRAEVLRLLGQLVRSPVFPRADAPPAFGDESAWFVR
jgi:hypothetical protein